MMDDSSCYNRIVIEEATLDIMSVCEGWYMIATDFFTSRLSPFEILRILKKSLLPFLLIGFCLLLLGCSEKEAMPILTSTAVPVEYQVAIWIPYHTSVELQTMQMNADVINEANFFWYEVRNNGQLMLMSGAENEAVLANAREWGLRIVPTITNQFDRERVSAILYDESLRQQHIETIVNKVITMDYDGIDIDYESLLAEDREVFSLFIEELAASLHVHNKILSIALYPKTEEVGTWDGPQAQDWRHLGAVADEVKIMTYDYHWSTSEAGPIAPVDWTIEVLDFAVATIPPSKIYVGIHFYGYDWQGTQATGRTWSEIQTILASQNSIIERDLSDEAWFTYEQDGRQRTVYFADSVSLQTKLEAVLIAHPNIAGIAIWRLGGEDPDNWLVIREK